MATTNQIEETCDCGESAEIRFTATTIDGEVLDTSVMCRPCAAGAAKWVGLELGTAKKS